MPRCDVCFRHCEISEGQLGFCGARTCINGKVVPSGYGRLSAILLDPIEKKPLSRFFPGSKVLSVGSFGCNLRCPFCQNSEISWGEESMEMTRRIRDCVVRRGGIPARGMGAPEGRQMEEDEDRNIPDFVSPEWLADTAARYREAGNIGVAFTYNEPLIGYEFVLDTAKLVHARGMKTVLVSNGTAELPVLDKLLPYIDAMNIDLKGFTDLYYSKVLGGDRRMVMDFITHAVQSAHVELTTLIIPGENDSEEEMRELSAWIANLRDRNGNLIGTKIPLHISRFFPRFHMTDRDATDVRWIYHLADVARERLEYVYAGNC